MNADTASFVLAWVGVATAVEARSTLRTAMIGAGGAPMLYFAYGAARDADTDWTATLGAERAGFMQALALALSNPYQIGFWLTVGVGLVPPGTLDVLAHLPFVGDSLAGRLIVRTGSPATPIGFFGGITAWIICFPAALVCVERRVDRFTPVVVDASAVVLGPFGIWFLADAVGVVG